MSQVSERREMLGKFEFDKPELKKGDNLKSIYCPWHSVRTVLALSTYIVRQGTELDWRRNDLVVNR
jgi:hypothetical protein